MSRKNLPLVDSLRNEREMARRRSQEWHARLVRAWHLAILRFAVTRENADWLGVFAIANGIDRLGSHRDDSPHFGFFRKTSTELCRSILGRSEAADLALRQYLARIDEGPLKRALAAALEIDPRDTIAVRRRRKPDNNLWRGLPSRGNVSQAAIITSPEKNDATIDSCSGITGAVAGAR